MGKVIVLINITADGFCDAQLVNANAEFHEFAHTLIDGAAVVGFGRNSFELFQQVWPAVLEKEGQPESQVRMARRLTDTPKLVFSHTLEHFTWRNSTIVKSADAGVISRYKAAGSGGLLTIGSPGLVADLTRQGLVDDYYFSVQPVIAGGGGFRLFDKFQLDARVPLKYVESKALGSGVIINHYQPA
ncbi:MAG TPA: dihydrofolate reductase family protein [Puia sp.]|nr:dihydrofolate reductase family protein [Puia sp.]